MKKVTLKTIAVSIIISFLISAFPINSLAATTSNHHYLSKLKKELKISKKNLKNNKIKRIKTINLYNSKVKKLKIAKKKVKKSKLKIYDKKIKQYRFSRQVKFKAYSKKIKFYTKKMITIQRKIKRYLVNKKEIGAYVAAPYSELPILESKLGQRLNSFLWYQSMDVNFDIDLAKWLNARGTKLQVSFEPREVGKGVNEQPNYQLRDITSGQHDAALYRWAQQVKDFGQPVYFRLMCEMNGDWVPWGGNANGNNPADYIPAWRHVHNIFKKVGATNALFVWSPNQDNDQAAAMETFLTYYPGDAYVDYIGINGYNWGTMYDLDYYTSRWLSFDQIFGPSYAIFTKSSTKPLMIPEMATTSTWGNKAQWIQDSFIRLRDAYPRIKMVTWFNVDKETDWRLEETNESLSAFKNYAF